MLQSITNLRNSKLNSLKWKNLVFVLNFRNCSRAFRSNKIPSAREYNRHQTQDRRSCGCHLALLCHCQPVTFSSGLEQLDPWNSMWSGSGVSRNVFSCVHCCIIIPCFNYHFVSLCFHIQSSHWKKERDSIQWYIFWNSPETED